MGITEEQYDYILAHINDRPRRKVAEAAGISMSTMYHIVREHGGELRYDLSTKHEGIEDAVRTYYPTMAAAEISERFGFSRPRITAWARKLGVKHDEECNERIRKLCITKLSSGRDKIDYKAAHKEWEKKRKYDEIRRMSGMRQVTGFRFSKYTTQQQRQTIWRMVNKRNYFQVEDEPYTLYYDEETNRTPFEDRLAKRHRLKFLPADNDDELINNDITENDDYGRTENI